MKIVDSEKLVLARYNKFGSLEPIPNSESKWLNVFSTIWEHKGKQGRWLSAARKNSIGNAGVDAVVVAAIFEEKLVLTRQYRIPILARELDFPAGLIDEDETVEEAAVREFKEETGLELKIDYVSPPSLYASAGMSNENIQIVFGKATGKVSYDGHESSEDIEVLLVDYNEVCQLVNSSEPVSAKAWPILLMLKELGKLDGTLGFSF